MTMLNKRTAILCSISLLLCAIPMAVFAEEASSSVAVVDTTEQDGSLDIETLTASDIVGEVEDLREADTKHFMLAVLKCG